VVGLGGCGRIGPWDDLRGFGDTRMPGTPSVRDDKWVRIPVAGTATISSDGTGSRSLIMVTGSPSALTRPKELIGTHHNMPRIPGTDEIVLVPGTVLDPFGHRGQMAFQVMRLSRKPRRSSTDKSLTHPPRPGNTAPPASVRIYVAERTSRRLARQKSTTIWWQEGTRSAFVSGWDEHPGRHQSIPRRSSRCGQSVWNLR